jgi:hypothetical protein
MVRGLRFCWEVVLLCVICGRQRYTYMWKYDRIACCGMLHRQFSRVGCIDAFFNKMYFAATNLCFYTV